MSRQKLLQKLRAIRNGDWDPHMGLSPSMGHIMYTWSSESLYKMTIKSHFLEIGLSLPSIFSNYSYFVVADCISEQPSRSMGRHHDRILARSLTRVKLRVFLLKEQWFILSLEAGPDYP
jgi:hypothetical protein